MSNESSSRHRANEYSRRLGEGTRGAVAAERVAASPRAAAAASSASSAAAAWRSSLARAYERFSSARARNAADGAAASAKIRSASTLGHRLVPFQIACLPQAPAQQEIRTPAHENRCFLRAANR